MLSGKMKEIEDTLENNNEFSSQYHEIKTNKIDFLTSLLKIQICLNQSSIRHEKSSKLSADTFLGHLKFPQIESFNFRIYAWFVTFIRFKCAFK